MIRRRQLIGNALLLFKRQIYIEGFQWLDAKTVIHLNFTSASDADILIGSGTSRLKSPKVKISVLARTDIED